MIVCHCNVITDHEIREAAQVLKKAKGGTVPTPGVVFKACGKRPKCGGCFKTIVDIVYKEYEDGEQEHVEDSSTSRRLVSGQ